MLTRLVLVLALGSLLHGQARIRITPGGAEAEAGCTVTVAPTQAAVSTALGSAASGDVVCMEAGSQTWTSGVTIPDGVTLKGTGTPSNDPGVVGPSATCQQTVITFNGSIIGFTMDATYGDTRPRLSCMELKDSGSFVAVAFEANGTCTASGCPELRIDNVTFTDWTAASIGSNSYGIGAIGNYFGVIDHNQVSGNGVSPADSYLQLVEIGLSAYLGVGAFGDNDWAQPEDFGSRNFLFFENNLMEDGASFVENETTVVANGGGRIVIRNNTTNQTGDLNGMMNWHGTESNGRPRAVHAYEFYRNTFTCTPGDTCGVVAGLRDGTGILWGNVINNISSNMNKLLQLTNTRAEADVGGWEACDGNAPYDTNDGGATPTVYFEGTVTARTGTQITVEGPGATNPGWTDDEWIPAGAPYAIHNVTQGKGHVITDNTADTLTYLNSGTAGAYNDAVGNTIQILRPTVCLDQPGRGAGQLYSGNPASPLSAANQALVPVYVLMTTRNGNAFTFGTQGVSAVPSNRIIRNRDFYMENLNQAAQTTSSSPFDGTTTIGSGHGIVSRRPATCTTGVSYWATDEGEWDSTNGATADGKMYICTATNTWSARYGGSTSNTSGFPFTYPHPLVTP